MRLMLLLDLSEVLPMLLPGILLLLVDLSDTLLPEQRGRLVGGGSILRCTREGGTFRLLVFDVPAKKF